MVDGDSTFEGGTHDVWPPAPTQGDQQVWSSQPQSFPVQQSWPQAGTQGWPAPQGLPQGVAPGWTPQGWQPGWTPAPAQKRNGWKIALLIVVVIVVGAVGATYQMSQAVNQFQEIAQSGINYSEKEQADSVAQSNLGEALGTADEIYTASGDYTEATVDGLNKISDEKTGFESLIGDSITYTNAPSPGFAVISVAMTPEQFAAAALSASGECFSLYKDKSLPSPGTFYGAGECNAALVLASPPTETMWDTETFGESSQSSEEFPNVRG